LIKLYKRAGTNVLIAGLSLILFRLKIVTFCNRNSATNAFLKLLKTFHLLPKNLCKNVMKRLLIF